MILSKQKNKLFSLFRALFARPSRNRRKFFVLGALVLVLILFFPRPAHAGAFAELVIGVLWVILYVCKAFVSLAAWILAFMLRSDIYNFSSEPIILVGWKICRDLCNLFFLLILIFIAFCTILQIEKYHAKKTLLTLIIMALLINFSKPIAIFIFDGSQLLMAYFIGNPETLVNTINKLSAIAEIAYNSLPGFFWRWITWKSDWAMAAEQFATIIFLFMYAVALLVMAIYLFIRLVALWVLIIVSPFAFLFAVIPDFKKYSDEWWSALFKYCYVGPILAFFLYLSTQLASSSFIKVAKQAEQGKNIITLGNAVEYIVVLVFLYASIIMAQKLGIAFASGITSGANKALKMGTGLTAAKWGGKKAWQGAKYGVKKGVDAFDSNFLAPRDWSPRAKWQAWRNRSEEIKQQNLGDATARAQEKLSQNFTAGKKPPGFYTQKRKAENVAKYRKEQELMGNSDDVCIAGINSLKGRKDPEAQERVLAYTQTLAAGRNLNEYTKKGLGKEMTSLGLKKDLTDLYKSMGMADEEIGFELGRISDMAYGAGDFHLYGMGVRNKDTGKWRASEADEQRDLVEGKLKNTNLQKLMIDIHPEATLRVAADGTPIGTNGDIGDVFFDRVVASGGKHLNRCRPDFIDKNLAVAKPLTYSGKSEFVELIEKQYETNEEENGARPAPATPRPARPTPAAEPPRIIPASDYRSRSKTAYDKDGKPVV